MLDRNSTTSQPGVIEALENLIDAADARLVCTTLNCNEPQVDQVTKDALSALGVTSTHCASCTRALLRQLLQEAA